MCLRHPARQVEPCRDAISQRACFPTIRFSRVFFSHLGISSDCEETDNAITEDWSRLVRLTVFFWIIYQIHFIESKLGVLGMTLPTNLDCPIIAIADLQGQLDQLKRLIAQLETLSGVGRLCVGLLGRLR